MKTQALEGKTIETATRMAKPGFDDTAWLHLRFTDGSECCLVGRYGRYTGNSEDDYPASLAILDALPEGLVPTTLLIATTK